MTGPQEFDPPRIVRRLIAEACTGALATLHRGFPYASLVLVSTAVDGAPILLLSRLARHTENILADPRASLLVEENSAEAPLERARATVSGRISAIDDAAARRRFLARHPGAASYAGFADFSFWRIEPHSAHLVAGFGRIADVPPHDLLRELSDATTLRDGEAEALAHMNDDHAEATALYATGLLGEEPGDWRMIGIDPDGCELTNGDKVRRLDFPQRATTPDALRQTLVALAREARKRQG